MSTSRFAVLNFTASLAEVADLWQKRNNDGLMSDENKYISRLSTGLVRICLNALGAYDRVPPFTHENVVCEAGEFMRRYGMLFIRQLLHLAIVTERENYHAYIYFLRVVLEYPHLWYRDIEESLNHARTNAPKVQEVINRWNLFGGGINIRNDISEFAADRYTEFARDKVLWTLNECDREQNLPSAIQGMDSVRNLPVRVCIKATSTPEEITVAYLTVVGIDPFGKEPSPIGLPEISFEDVDKKRSE